MGVLKAPAYYLIHAESLKQKSSGNWMLPELLLADVY
jgi:hypothetical protein